MPEEEIKSSGDQLTYKGRPLRRSGNEIYYGSMADKYIITMQVADTTDFSDIKLSGKIAIQLVLTDQDIKPKDRVVKRSEKQGLYNALDIGAIWLELALTEGKH